MKSAAVDGISFDDSTEAKAVIAAVDLFPMRKTDAIRRLRTNKQTVNQHCRRWLDVGAMLPTEEDFIELYFRLKASSRDGPRLSYHQFDVLKDQARSDLESQGIDRPTHRQILDVLELAMKKFGISQQGARNLL
jgi:hypothetical protein